MNKISSKIEVLAPCGSYDILVAAVHAGADACYIGGNSFGARAYAENFDTDTIRKAVRYAHLHGVRVYLTVNTLVKEEEFPDLYAYIKPFYEVGGDALIIQDLGVFDYVRKQFPDIAIHCSTQMNITSRYGAAMMRRQGATRVVTAREMSLAEIRDIKEHVDVEIETFVHGAMCYSYSGQCLMSSLAGGRSGNRGRCAQPCRKCYDGSYLLSMKDMCTLKDIPKLIEAGIDSLKIEGRMKNIYYVASAVHAYRTMVDDYVNGCFDEKKAEALTFELANIYNRGGFSDGYFFRRNDAGMISKNRPNNQGVCIGELKNTGNGTVHILLHETLYKQDVLELVTKNKQIIEITTSKEGKKGETVILNCPKTKQLAAGQKIYRTRCAVLLDKIEKQYMEDYPKLPVKMHVHAKIGDSIEVHGDLQIRDSHYKAFIQDSVVERSNGQTLTMEAIQKPFGQLGNTDYTLAEFTLDADPDAFLPAGLLKKLRRSLLEQLEQQVSDTYARIAPAPLNLSAFYPASGQAADADTTQEIQGRLVIGVSSLEQFTCVLGAIEKQHIKVGAITVPAAIYTECARQCDDSVVLYAELPHVIRAGQIPDLQDSSIRGIYIRNIDGFALAGQLRLPEACEFLFDASLYCYNRAAFAFVRSLTGHRITFAMPRELTLTELEALSDESLCLTLYEYQPVMISANCVQRTTNGCSHSDSVVPITDDRKNRFFAACYCKDCYNVIYNKLPYSILDIYQDTAFTNIHKGGYMLRFTLEDKAQIEHILRAYADGHPEIKERTTGHLYRGVL